MQLVRDAQGATRHELLVARKRESEVEQRALTGARAGRCRRESGDWGVRHLSSRRGVLAAAEREWTVTWAVVVADARSDAESSKAREKTMALAAARWRWTAS